MTLNMQTIIDTVVSHALASGRFERVNAHEPRSTPGTGLTAAVWVDRIAPARSSGLASTSALVVLLVRVYSSMLTQPADAIDPRMSDAVSDLLAAYSGDFELAAAARCIDLLGQAGTPLSVQAGYVQQDGAVSRVYTITVPVIVNDVWEQTP